ncbi:hypothetical protein [Alkalinema sp. FACHB-956]|uniref:hypothetical protein n=1 Tax=Alkalinema sp. FACHB-956 TaxID=2692768 RepID=UPI0016892DB4|nr:hypothetical protein [Alkalinema sp. FACHB-956]MBD2326034.1 hypothetical protein [Alkalinema sp. FACHB-956]
MLGCSVDTGFESLQDYLTSHEDRLIPEEKIYFKHLFHQFQQVYPSAVPGELINIGWLPLDESD